MTARGAGISDVDVILDHARRGSGRRGPGEESGDVIASHRLVSRTCGDEITVDVVREEVPSASGAPILVLRWSGHGCEVSQASASMLVDACETARPTSLDELDALVVTFLDAMVAAAGSPIRPSLPITDDERLGDAVSLLSLARNAVRASCSTLAWRTLGGAIAWSRAGEAS